VEHEPPSKNKKLYMQRVWLVTELEKDDDFEMYGRKEKAQHKITAFTFEVINNF
jgi:hypothetical protein